MTTIYQGFDRSTYPGDSTMQRMFDYIPPSGSSTPNLWFCGYYLGKTSTHPGPCCHSSSSWTGHRATLANQGWGFLPIYVGYQWKNSLCGDCGGSPCCDISTFSSSQATSQGKADAQNAAALMSDEGFPSLSVVFLDIEEGGTLQSVYMDYITAWINEMNTSTSYWAGVYVHKAGLDQIVNVVGANQVTGWVIDLVNGTTSCGTNNDSPPAAPDPTKIDSNAQSAQYVWDCTYTITDSQGTLTVTNVDYDSSIYTDPSQHPVQ